MTFGEKLQQLRKKQGLSQEELAERLEVSRQAISKWENEGSVPDSGKIVALSRIFSVSTDYLLLDEEELPQAKGPAGGRTARRWLPAAAVGAGGLGNGVIYLLSRAIKVPVPLRTPGPDGKIWYTWNGYEDHSFRYFVQEYDLELLVNLFWLLLAAGLVLTFAGTGTGKKLICRGRDWLRSRRRGEESSSE